MEEQKHKLFERIKLMENTFFDLKKKHIEGHKISKEVEDILYDIENIRHNFYDLFIQYHMSSYKYDEAMDKLLNYLKL